MKPCLHLITEEMRPLPTAPWGGRTSRSSALTIC